MVTEKALDTIVYKNKDETVTCALGPWGFMKGYWLSVGRQRNQLRNLDISIDDRSRVGDKVDMYTDKDVEVKHQGE